MGGNFYVYEHWRPDLDVCFYVGKGKGRRANDMRRGRNRYHKFIQAKLSSAGLAVEVRIVAGCLSEDEAFQLEMERIAFWRGTGADLANMTNGGEGPSGRKHTEEWKLENSKRNKGRKMPDGARAKIAAALIGNKNGLGSKKSPEAVERTAAAHRGKKRSAEAIAKMVASKKGKPGHKWTEEQKLKSSLIQTGRKKSEETRARMRKPKSEEHKAKLSAINIGKTHSAETRRLLSEKAKLQWQARKENAAKSLMEK
jgi:hypothetical protein